MTHVSTAAVNRKRLLTAVCIVALAGCSFRRPYPERQAAVAAVSGREIDDDARSNPPVP